MTKSKIKTYSSVYSRNSAIKILSKDFSFINQMIKKYDEKFIDKTYLDYFKYIYKVLEKQYQNEYIYKNSFLNKYLIKNSSYLFSELKLGNNIVDLASFNEISSAFEIKTHLDTKTRLNDQINAYKKVFNEIYLIVPSSKVEEYLSFNSDVGIIDFPEFKIHRNPNLNFDICPENIMQILHTKEYKNIVLEYFGYLPCINSFNQFKICGDMIKKIPSDKLSTLLIEQLKIRSYNEKLSIKNYKEFNQLFLSLKLDNAKRKAFINILKQSVLLTI